MHPPYGGLTIVPHPLDLIAHEIARERALADAAYPLIVNLASEHECKHGRLPTDSSPPCGCWKEES